METKREIILDHLRKFPNATNEEIAEAADTSLGYVKQAIHYFKKRRHIEVTSKEGKRFIVVLKDTEEVKDFKKEVYEEMLPPLLDKMNSGISTKELTEISRVVIAILNKM